ncbi:MAG: sugar phosphate nucleotidyltransferase [Terracidiphilus sp.]
MSSPTLLIMAAGMGSRYGGLKQIDPVGPGGESILEYSIYDALRAGFGKVVFVIRRDIEQAFNESIGSRFEARIPVEYVFQELDELPPGFSVPSGRSKPWGTTHAVLTAADVIHEPFAVINADDFYGAESYKLLAQHLQSSPPDYAMIGFILRETLSDFGSVTRGVCRCTAQGYLDGIEELTCIERDGDHARNTDGKGRVTSLTGDETVSMNMWGFTPQIFPQLRQLFEEFLECNGTDLRAECYLPKSLNQLVAEGQARVKVLRSRSTWFGVTYREDRPLVTVAIARLVNADSYPRKLWS